MRFQVVPKDSCVYVINVAVLFKYFQDKFKRLKN